MPRRKEFWQGRTRKKRKRGGEKDFPCWEIRGGAYLRRWFALDEVQSSADENDQ